MSSRYNFDRADYPLLQAIRMRRGVLSWGLGLTAWALLLGSTLIAEEHDNRLHWVRTGIIAATLPIAALGRLAVEDSVKAGRVLLDYEDVTDAGRQQLLWHETTDEVQQGDAIEAAAPAVEVVDAWEYLAQAAKEWRSHLALLSPTDTGKKLVSVPAPRGDGQGETYGIASGGGQGRAVAWCTASKHSADCL
jgi:hypothetical protein